MQLLRTGKLSDEEAAVALYDWRAFWAREEQIAPDWNWRRWLLLAGRGFGKTRTLAEWVIEQAQTGAGPGHIVARVKDDIEKVLIKGPAGVLARSPPWFYPKWTKGVLKWPNGVEALTFSAQEPDQLRGPQCAWAAGDEFAAWEYIEEAYGNLTFGLRLGRRPQLLLATTPRPLRLLRELVKENGKSTHVTRGSTFDNKDNLSAEALDDMQKRYAGTRRGRQELDGEILDDVPGALWSRAMLQAAVERGQAYSSLRRIDARDEHARAELRRQLEMFDRIVIAVDPSGSPGAERGDAIGIVVVGKLKHTNEAVVLEDATCQERPEVWCANVATLFNGWDADLVVAEGNYGGDMVRALIARAGAGGNMPVKIVTASRGKHVRAEPISGLYEQGRVHHARPFPMLDDELAQFTANGWPEDEPSPNRADALVWALTELMLAARAEPRIRRL